MEWNGECPQLHVRVHLQTIFGADNVIVTLGGGGGRDVKIINLCHVLLAVRHG